MMNKRIEHYQELLNVLPRNNIKNKKEYLKKAIFMKKVAQEYKNQLLKDIQKRYSKIVVKRDTSEIENLNNYLEDVRKNLYLLNKYNDSYEKSNLNEVLYDIKKYYKSDLEKVNQDIDNALRKFSLVGISLKESDFNYGKEVRDYMKIFLQNSDNNVVLKEEFDRLYWKNPDIIDNINLNFRYLYFKNKKKFEKYYDTRLKELNIKDEKKYLDEYEDNLWKYILLKESNIDNLQDKFLSSNLDIKDYDESKVSKLKQSLLIKDDDENNEDNFTKLSCTLYEYKNYLRFKKIIDNIKEIYQDKNNKNLTKSILKNIAKFEKKISKINKKLKHKMFFKGKSYDGEKFYIEINKNVIELKNLYSEYDEAKFKEAILNNLNDNSSLLDILKLSASFKINLIKILKIDNEEISNDELNKEINDLNEFIYYPKNSFINTITILDTRDIETIILDKYKLMNINITKDQIEQSNIDSLINTVNKVLVSNYIKKAEVNYEDIQDACEMKKILDKENL